MTHAVRWLALARRTGILEPVPLFTRLQVSMLVSRRPMGVGRNLAGAWITRRKGLGVRYQSDSEPSPDLLPDCARIAQEFGFTGDSSTERNTYRISEGEGFAVDSKNQRDRVSG
jgi:hypothetical protein